MIENFLERLKLHTERKAKLYDGFNQDIVVDRALRYAIEELGEIATAITRQRYNSAMDECIDLAHCAFLLYKAISTNKEDIK
jgi:NTP pyrophosphatase (non-canonical NTP hydrolase)